MTKVLCNYHRLLRKIAIFLINIWHIGDGIITVGVGLPGMVYANVEGVGHHSSYYCALGVFLEEPEPIWLKPQGKGKIEWQRR